MPRNEDVKVVLQILKRKNEISQKDRDELIHILKAQNLYTDRLDSYNQEQLVEYYLINILTESEKNLYLSYLRALQSHAINTFNECIDSFESQIADINTAYDSKKEKQQKRHEYQLLVKETNKEYFYYPYFRIVTCYNTLKRAYNDYNHSQISYGMKSADIHDELVHIERSGFITRTISKQKTKRLKQNLKDLKHNSHKEIKDKANELKRAIKDYYAYLLEVFKDLFKFPSLKKGILLSSNALFKTNYSEKDELTIEQIQELFEKFINTIEINNTIDLTPDLFTERIKQFVVYYYEQQIAILTSDIDGDLRRINDIFEEQRIAFMNMKETQNHLNNSNISVLETTNMDDETLQVIMASHPLKKTK